MAKNRFTGTRRTPHTAPHTRSPSRASEFQFFCAAVLIPIFSRIFFSPIPSIFNQMVGYLQTKKKQDKDCGQQQNAQLKVELKKRMKGENRKKGKTKINGKRFGLFSSPLCETACVYLRFGYYYSLGCLHIGTCSRVVCRSGRHNSMCARVCQKGDHTVTKRMCRTYKFPIVHLT